MADGLCVPGEEREREKGVEWEERYQGNRKEENECVNGSGDERVGESQGG